MITTNMNPANNSTIWSTPKDKTIIELDVFIQKSPQEYRKFFAAIHSFSEHKLARHLIDEKIQELKNQYQIVGSKQDVQYGLDNPTRDFQVWVTLLVVEKTEDEKYVECLNYFLNQR